MVHIVHSGGENCREDFQVREDVLQGLRGQKDVNTLSYIRPVRAVVIRIRLVMVFEVSKVGDHCYRVQPESLD